VVGRGRLCAALAVALLAAVLAGSAGGTTGHGVTLLRNGADQQYVPGQVVVGFRPNVDPVTRRLVVSNADAKTVHSLPRVGAQVLHVRGSVEAAIADLESNPAVAYAEPNWIYHADAVPNDPRYSQDYGLARIQAAQAWDVTTGSAGVTVAVVDTGIATDHLDLAANVVPGHDFVQDDADPRDFNGHGTHVAGTIGAKGDNGIGVAGVNWNVHLMPVRVLDGDGSGSSSDITSGFLYACTHGARIVNASLGGGGYYTPMRQAIASPECANTLFVVAAGNDGSDNDKFPHYPCNYGGPPDNLPNVICVAATDQSDTLASFSNYGPASVDLAAPGVAVTSTWPAYDTLYAQDFEDPFADWTRTGAFNRSPEHANGAFSMSDSPGGNYGPGISDARAPAPVASFSGRSGCQAAYNLRFDTQAFEDYSGVELSGDGFASYVWSGWSGSSHGSFLALTSDFSALDNAPSVSVGVIMHANNDGTVADGGFLDDLRLRCLKPGAEDYNTISGTSMATPHVAGVAALVLAAHPAYSTAQLAAAVLGSTDPLSSLSGKVTTGGRLNACRAVGGSCPAVTPPFTPPACVVPNVVGAKLGRAGSKIRARHCRVGKVAHVASTKQRKGKVVRETPKAGKHLASRAKVNLWIGSGPKRK
jgi:subtilisin family serine protease